MVIINFKHNLCIGICLLFLCLCSSLVYSRDKKLTNLQTLYSSTETLHIDEIIFTERVTELVITAKGKIFEEYIISKEAYISDEKDNKYQVKYALGIALDEPSYIPRNGENRIRLFFEPMDKSTEIFDFIDPKRTKIYGIHQKKRRKWDFEKNIPTNINSDSLNQAGTALIRGKINRFYHSKDSVEIKFDVNTLETYTKVVSYEESRPHTLLEEDGTFEVEVQLEHPIWSFLTIEGKRNIPFYICPNDTLDINMIFEIDGVKTEYSSAHLNETCSNLMKHVKFPIIKYSWEELTDFGRQLDEEYFLERVNECVEKNMRLCNYWAWKYGFSEWEHHLLSNRIRISLFERYILFAAQIFRNKVKWNTRLDMKKEDFIGFDYSVYKIINILPLNDPTLSVVCFWDTCPYSLEMSTPAVYPKYYVKFDDDINDETQVFEKLCEMQIQNFQELITTKEIPWVIQTFLVNKIVKIESNEERERAVKIIESYLTYPSLKERLWKMYDLLKLN